MFTVRVDQAALSKTIRQLEAAFKPANLQSIAVLAMGEQLGRIRQRTRFYNRDFQDSAFHPYSEDYRRRKKQTRVDLFSKDGPEHMLDMMKVERMGTSAARMTITDSRKAEIAEFHNEGTSKMPKRRFFDVSPKDEVAMETSIEKLFRKTYGDLFS